MTTKVYQIGGTYYLDSKAYTSVPRLCVVLTT